MNKATVDEQEMPTKTTELIVEMTCSSCVSAVTSSLNTLPGIRSFTVDLPSQRVVISSLLSDADLLNAISLTGRRARVIGHGSTSLSSSSSSSSSPPAVAEFKYCPAQGLIRFVQLTEDTALVDGTIDGLIPNTLNGVQIHESGDLSDDWRSVGAVANIRNASIENLMADAAGRGVILKEMEIKTKEIIGLAVVVHYSPNPSDGSTNASKGRGWSVIARSAGTNQNNKMICNCDGTVIWTS